MEGSGQKRFRTMAQAEAFIEGWKGAYAEVWGELIKEVLDRGFRPRDIRSFGSCEMGLFTNHSYTSLLDQPMLMRLEKRQRNSFLYKTANARAKA